MPPRRTKTEYVVQAIIRQKFNESQYPEMIAKGELVPMYLHDKQLKDPSIRRFPEPDGTRSQMIRYVDKDGKWLVEVHQYLRPDGTLGASGKSDPKRLKINDKIYIAKRE